MPLSTAPETCENGKIEIEEPPAHVTVKKREALRKRFLARLQRGADFGGVKFNREEVYEDRMHELEAHRS